VGTADCTLETTKTQINKLAVDIFRRTNDREIKGLLHVWNSRTGSLAESALGNCRTKCTATSTSKNPVFIDLGQAGLRCGIAE
jgi:hypothetical protein